jgi:hypothetical protein
MVKSYSLEELKKMKSKTDVDKFNSTSEKEILEQSISDPDTPVLNKKELEELKPAKKKDTKNEQK